MIGSHPLNKFILTHHDDEQHVGIYAAMQQENCFGWGFRVWDEFSGILPGGHFYVDRDSKEKKFNMSNIRKLNQSLLRVSIAIIISRTSDQAN